MSRTGQLLFFSGVHTNGSSISITMHFILHILQRNSTFLEEAVIFWRTGKFMPVAAFADLPGLFHENTQNGEKEGDARTGFPWYKEISMDLFMPYQTSGNAMLV
jgi:hypothetical protein